MIRNPDGCQSIENIFQKYASSSEALNETLVTQNANTSEKHTSQNATASPVVTPPFGTIFY